MTATPKDQILYKKVKAIADKKFATRTSIYKSSWIVQEYKRLGGSFLGNKPKQTGLKRWYREKWVDLNRPIKNSSGQVIGYKQCGREYVKDSKEKYPLCRPTFRITSKTPRTYSEITSESIRKAKKLKAKVKGSANIKFGI